MARKARAQERREAERARKEDILDDSEDGNDEDQWDPSAPSAGRARNSARTQEICTFDSTTQMRAQLPALLGIEASILERMIILAFKQGMVKDLDFADRVNGKMLLNLAMYLCAEEEAATPRPQKYAPTKLAEVLTLLPGWALSGSLSKLHCEQFKNRPFTIQDYTAKLQVQLRTMSVPADLWAMFFVHQLADGVRDAYQQALDEKADFRDRSPSFTEVADLLHSRAPEDATAQLLFRATAHHRKAGEKVEDFAHRFYTACRALDSVHIPMPPAWANAILWEGLSRSERDKLRAQEDGARLLHQPWNESAVAAQDRHQRLADLMRRTLPALPGLRDSTGPATPPPGTVATAVTWDPPAPSGGVVAVATAAPLPPAHPRQQGAPHPPFNYTGDRARDLAETRLRHQERRCYLCRPLLDIPAGAQAPLFRDCTLHNRLKRGDQARAPGAPRYQD